MPSPVRHLFVGGALRRGVPPVWIVALLATGASALAALDAPAERERIRHEREQAEATFRREVAECQQRFVVTACTDEAKRRRRATLVQLREQEHLLDREQRQQRALDRSERVDERAAAPRAAATAPAPAASAAPVEPSAATAGESPASAAAPALASPRRAPARQPVPHPSTPREPAAAGPTPAEREAARASYAAKQKDAAARRAAAAQRIEQRRRSGKPAGIPLPVPPAASAVAAPADH